MTTERVGAIEFGAFLRRLRLARKLSLRRMARSMPKMTASYLSQIERAGCPLPTEQRIRELAQILDVDVDDLLARAGRISTDLVKIICLHPSEFAKLLRNMQVMSPKTIALLACEAQRLAATHETLSEEECNESVD